jgi:hypothetical protein
MMKLTLNVARQGNSEAIMDTGIVGANTGSDLMPSEGDFQDAIEMFAATQMVGIIQDSLSYAEKQMQKKKEEERQEGY